MALSISKNGKYLLCTYQSGNTYLLDNTLNILYKYLFDKGDRKKLKNIKNGFNLANREFFL